MALRPKPTAAARSPANWPVFVVGWRRRSSPLVPILIAIVVLAAISIAVVIYRQKRQSDGQPGSPSPKAS